MFLHHTSVIPEEDGQNNWCTHPEVGSSEAVGGGGCGRGGGCRVRKIGIDVGQQVAHDGRHTGTHVFGGETGEVPGSRGVEKKHSSLQ